ncbi:MAG: hypothetical protein NT080_04605 [Spirochaetes bacterium]|nr:hypothetical protein [Spirochaetota bacterium]
MRPSPRASRPRIPDVRLEPPGRAIGRTTAQAVQAGILLGYGGLVSRLVELQREELGEESEVIGTGDAIGNGIMQACGFGRFQPELVLDGLAAIAIRNP